MMKFDTTWIWKNSKSQISGWDFCLFWLGDAQINDRGFKSKCDKLLSDILGVTISTAEKWGHRYEKMPVSHQRHLAKTLALHLAMNDPATKERVGIKLNKLDNLTEYQLIKNLR